MLFLWRGLAAALQLPAMDARIGRLSGGERRRAEIARALAANPSIMLLDEPFAGINPVVKDTLIELLLHENRSRGAAFLIVSHEMEIVRMICPRVTVMIAGRVAAEGPLDEIGRREDIITAYLGGSLQ